MATTEVRVIVETRKSYQTIWEEATKRGLTIDIVKIGQGPTAGNSVTIRVSREDSPESLASFARALR